MNRWDLIRSALNAVIDACEASEKANLGEAERAKTIKLKDGHQVTFFDLQQSMFTLPDNLKYSVIRARSKLDDDKAYTTETKP